MHIWIDLVGTVLDGVDHFRIQVATLTSAIKRTRFMTDTLVPVALARCCNNPQAGNNAIFSDAKWLERRPTAAEHGTSNGTCERHSGQYMQNRKL